MGTSVGRRLRRRLETSYRQDETLRDRLEAWGVDRFGTGAFGGSDRGKWRFVSLPAVAEEVAPRLRLTLHERYTRPDVYGLFGINYDTRRTRHLNTGLSPRMPDGGYFIFITLDKDTIAGIRLRGRALPRSADLGDSPGPR